MTWGEDILQLLQKRLEIGEMVTKALKEIYKELRDANAKTKSGKIPIGEPTERKGTYEMTIGGQLVQFTVDEVKIALRSNFVTNVTQRDVNLAVGDLVQRDLGIFRG